MMLFIYDGIIRDNALSLSLALSLSCSSRNAESKFAIDPVGAPDEFQRPINLKSEF